MRASSLAKSLHDVLCWYVIMLQPSAFESKIQWLCIILQLAGRPESVDSQDQSMDRSLNSRAAWLRGNRSEQISLDSESLATHVFLSLDQKGKDKCEVRMSNGFKTYMDTHHFHNPLSLSVARAKGFKSFLCWFKLRWGLIQASVSMDVGDQYQQTSASTTDALTRSLSVSQPFWLGLIFWWFRILFLKAHMSHLQLYDFQSFTILYILLYKTQVLLCPPAAGESGEYNGLLACLL